LDDQFSLPDIQNSDSSIGIAYTNNIDSGRLDEKSDWRWGIRCGVSKCVYERAVEAICSAFLVFF
jgi:hypothetical protein